MKIEDFGEFLFEIGDVLVDPEDGSVSILVGAHWAIIDLYCMTGVTHPGIYTHSTDNFDGYTKAGHVEQCVIDELREEEMRKWRAIQNGLPQG